MKKETKNEELTPQELELVQGGGEPLALGVGNAVGGTFAGLSTGLSGLSKGK